MQKIKQFFPFGILFLSCLFAMLPLFHSGFFPMHDDEQVARLFEMVKVLGQGQIPPRWVPDLGFGFGYPLFNFYPPFVYYLGAFFHLFHTSYIDATKLVMGSGFVLSAWFCYLWIKNRFGKLAGIFGAILYTYVPYHAVDIYVRGALSDFFSFVFIPGVLWCLDCLAQKPTRRHIALSSMLLCLVVLTHTLLMLQFVPFLILYSFYLLYEKRAYFKKLFFSFAGVYLLGFGMSAYFAIPSVLEKQYTLVDSILITQLANYAIHFVCPLQLWNSPWGYGGSIAGCVDGLSFQAGKMHILLSLLAFGIGLFIWLIKRKKQGIYVVFLGLLFFISLFLTTEYAKFIWDAVRPLWYIQFPWRFLLFAALFSSALGGFVIGFLQKKVNWKIALLVALVIVGADVYLLRNDFRPQSYILVGDDHYVEHNDIQWRVSGLSYEYVPKQVATKLSSIGTTQLAIAKKDIPTHPFSVVTGDMRVQVTKDTAIEKDAEVLVGKSGVLRVNTYAFAGWDVFVDGQHVAYEDNNALHLIEVPLSTGRHSVLIVFKNTPIRTISNAISVMSCLLVIFLLFWPRRLLPARP